MDVLFLSEFDVLGLQLTAHDCGQMCRQREPKHVKLLLLEISRAKECGNRLLQPGLHQAVLHALTSYFSVVLEMVLFSEQNFCCR